MLAGHPQLFCPPELRLVQYVDLAERRDRMGGGDAARTAGTVRAMMELESVGRETAEAMLAGFVAARTTVEQFYAYLMGRLGDRLLVEKSTDYAMSDATLRRANDLFPEAKFIHLVRHPGAVVESYTRTHMDLLNSGYATGDPAGEAEAVWQICHANILGLVEEVGSGRALQVRYEDLVADPRSTMEAIAAFLGVEFHEAMLTPYDGRAGPHDRRTVAGHAHGG